MGIIKIAKTLRNHWKKSTFGFIALFYSSSYLKTKYETNILMQACCKEAIKYGEEKLPVSKQPRSITVILNPAANKRKAKTEYEKYCDPLFHLAGISVNLIQTNAEGHAKELIENIPDKEPIIIAGGDGTLSETITGILRKNEMTERSIGILPLGRQNYTGNKLFPLNNNNMVNHVKQLTNATMAIIENEVRYQDVLKIETLESNSEAPGKPIFSVGPIEWGAFRDAKIKRDKYWIYGGFREYATYLFNGYKSSLCWDCKGTLKYTLPCAGCSNCRKQFVPSPRSFSWKNIIIPKTISKQPDKDYSTVNNDKCGEINEICFKSTELDLIPVEANNDSPPYLEIMLNRMTMNYIDFVKEGWQRVQKKRLNENNNSTKARTVEIIPVENSTPEKEIFFNIDNEEFDVKPIRITLLPNVLKIYCKKRTS